MQARLRSGITVKDCHDSFVYAAALMAVSVVRTLEDDQLSGFDAGTLKLNFADRTDQLIGLAAQLIEPWCRADDFAFQGVRG